MLELDFPIDRTGRVSAPHAEMYARLGTWIRGCYGAPIHRTNGTGTTLVLSLPEPTLTDRVLVQEELRLGQRVRNFTVQSQAHPGGVWQSYGGPGSTGNNPGMCLLLRYICKHMYLIQYYIIAIH